MRLRLLIIIVVVLSAGAIAGCGGKIRSLVTRSTVTQTVTGPTQLLTVAGPTVTQTVTATTADAGTAPNEQVSSSSVEGPGSYSHAGDAQFCTTHTCIPNFPNGSGYVVECTDTEWSHSGGRSGACSYHGGVLSKS